MLNKADFDNKRILSIDYGLKRIGFAYTDALHISINYLPFMENNDKFYNNLQRIIKEFNIEAILIGKPPIIYNNDEFSNSLEGFIIFVKENLDVIVTTYDESHSTEESYKLFSEAKVKKSKRKENKDSFAAGVILRKFLEEC
ncbi:MAG TPA: Holliday junction resolvase RuvX [Candidatus Kapabacteria bacterium]|nr:Holliday junction resolvase RuvX [Candidatus Kapabacteria bacterium]